MHYFLYIYARTKYELDRMNRFRDMAYGHSKLYKTADG